MIATKKISPFTAGAVNKLRDHGKSHVDESHSVIVNGGAAGAGFQEGAIALSDDEGKEGGASDEETGSDSDSCADEEGDDQDADSPTEPTGLANGVHASDPNNSDVETNKKARAHETRDVEEENNAEPSFGDLVAARSTKPISITESVLAADAGALVTTGSDVPAVIPAGISLATVLTQALRTNDNNLLESCFHNTDTQTIRATIQRIDSSLAGILIQSLAERLSSRPGRYGHLLIWVQWICVAHGGAIAGRPDVRSKIKTLYKVLNERSKALDSLLLLKGKLDTLDAQLNLRKQLSADRAVESDPDAGHVVYIEGEENDESSDEDEAMADADVQSSPRRIQEKQSLGELVADLEDEFGDEQDMPMTNGVVAETDISDFDSDSDGDGPIPQSEGGLVDDEAEESDEDSHPSDNEDDDSEPDDGSGDDEEDSEMNGFIDDGPIEEIDSASEISIDIAPEKPPSKRIKRA